MKKLALIAVCLLFSTTLMCQSKFSNTIEAMEKIDGITIIKISKPMFKFIESLNIDYPIHKLAGKIENFTLITCDNIGDKQKSFSDLIATAESQIFGLNYDALVSIKDGDTTVGITAEEPKNDTIKDFIIFSIGSDKIVLLFIEGYFKPKDLAEFMSMVQ